MPLGAQEHARAVEIAALGVEVGRAHGQVEGVDLGHDGERARTGRRPPRILALLDDADGGGPASGPNTDKMTGKLPDQVASWHPGRQPEQLAGSCRAIDRAGNLEEMRARIERAETVENRASGQERVALDNSM